MRFIDHLGQPLPLEDWKSWNRTLADAYEELGLSSEPGPGLRPASGAETERGNYLPAPPDELL